MIEWSRKARWKWYTAEYMVSLAHGKAMWCQHCAEVQTSWSEAWYTICWHLFAVQREWRFEVFVLVTDGPDVSMKLHEALSSHIKNQLEVLLLGMAIEHYLWTCARSPKRVMLRSVGKVCLAWQQMFPMSPWSFMNLCLGVVKLC